MKSVELPDKIKKLMIAELWIAKDDCPLNEELKKDFNWTGKINLFNNIEKNDAGLFTTSQTKFAKNTYGTYRTGDRDDEKNLDWIDANKTIMIACNHDEESICLDYRFSKTNPRIVATYYETLPQHIGRWKEIAKSEEELIMKLGIGK